MPNQYTNKVIYEGQTLIDLTADTVSPNNLLDGETAHDRSGAEIQGAVSVPAVYDGLDSSSTTDALSANQGRLLNEKFGVLLWTNSSPSSNFIGQAIPVAAGYARYRIEYAGSTGNTKQTGEVTIQAGGYGTLHELLLDTSFILASVRTVYNYTSGQISFTDCNACWNWHAPANVGTDNARMIPLRIYGVS